MRIPVQFRLATLATAALATIATTGSAIAASLFSQQEVDQSRFALIASPYGGGTAHQLLIVEQLSNARPCWSEGSSNGLTTIKPLLTEFDFTNICGRSIDSNGYSLRTAGEDQGWKYNLRVVKRDNDMLLLGVPAVDRRAPELIIGRTKGVTSGFAKFFLEPGWKVAKRVYNGTPIGHVYLTNEQTLASLNAAALAAKPTAPAPLPPIVNKPAPKPTLPVGTKPAPQQPPVVSKPVPKPLPPVASTPKPGTATPIPVPPPETTGESPISNSGGFKPGPKDFVVPTIVIP